MIFYRVSFQVLRESLAIKKKKEEKKSRHTEIWLNNQSCRIGGQRVN